MLIGVSMLDCGWGGMQIQTLNHIKYSKKENEFIIFAESKGQMSKIFEELPNIKKVIYCSDYEIAKKAKEEDIEIFLHHTAIGQGRDSVIFLKEKRIPTVIFHHCAWKPLYDANLATEFITTSDSNFKIIRENNSFKDKHIHKIPLSFDVENKILASKEERKKTRKKWKIPQKRLIVGRFGRLDPGKCIEDFLEAAAKIKAAWDGKEKLFFVIGGCLDIFAGKKHFDKLKAKAKKLGLKEGNKNADILFAGEMSETEKMKLINEFDVYLYPTNWEGYCMVFLEAMFLFKPIVTYDNFANKETVGGGGVVVEDKNINMLVTETIKLLKDKKKRIELGKKGWDLVWKRNNVANFASKIDKILDSVQKKNIKKIETRKNIHIAYFGWGLVEQMESTPEYLFLKYASKMKGITLDFFCVTQAGRGEFNGVKVNRIQKFNAKLFSKRPDVIHINHSENPLSWEAAKWGKENGIPVVMQIHSFKESITKYFPLVDKFIVMSEKEFDFRLDEIIDANKMIQIANGIELKKYKKNDNNKLKEFDNGKVNILFIGQMFAWKGIFTLLEVAHLLQQKTKNFQFHVVTHVRNSAVEGQFLDVLQRMDLKDYVKYYPSNHGERQFEELLKIYGSADIFYLPTENDCYPTTILEAAASKLPCIATAIGGIPNQIDHETTGFHLAKDFILDQSVNRLFDLVKNKELRKKMGEAAYKKIKRENDVERQIKKTVNVYQGMTQFD